MEGTGWNIIRIHEDGIHEAHSLRLMSGADIWQARAFVKDGGNKLIKMKGKAKFAMRSLRGKLPCWINMCARFMLLP